MEPSRRNFAVHAFKVHVASGYRSQDRLGWRGLQLNWIHHTNNNMDEVQHIGDKSRTQVKLMQSSVVGFLDPTK